MSDGTYIGLEVVSRKKNALETYSIFMKKADYEQKRKSATPLSMRNAPTTQTSKTQGGYSSTDSIRSVPDVVKGENSSAGNMDERLLDFYSDSITGRTMRTFELEPLSDRAAADVLRLLGRDVSGYGVRLSARAAARINTTHGLRGDTDRSMKDPRDVARMQYVLSGYDEVKPGTAGAVEFAKTLNGSRWVVTAEPDAAARTLRVTDMYRASADTRKNRGRDLKRWERYRYENLVAQDPITLVTIDDTVEYGKGAAAREAVVDKALQNAKPLGRTTPDGKVLVYVEALGNDVVLAKSGLRHGLDRRISLNAPVTIKTGEMLKDAVLVNELSPDREHISGAYVLLGAAKNNLNQPYIVEFVIDKYDRSVEEVDVLYSVNTKREPAAFSTPEIAGIPLFVTGSDISISQLLDIATQFFPDVLPESVLRHYGFSSRPTGKVGGNALFSVDIAPRRCSLASPGPPRLTRRLRCRTMVV